MSTKKHQGSCHCGAVRFEVEIDATRGSRCNCSICTKLNPTGGMVKPPAFTLKQGKDSLSAYQWGAKISARYFCKHCGTYCYGEGSLPELGGAFVSVNLQCLDDMDPGSIQIGYWDGRHNNWQAGTREHPWPV